MRDPTTNDTSTRTTTKRAPVTLAMADRFLIDLPTAAALMSVSTRTAKRIAVDFPELTAQVGRRRLFIREKLLGWLAAGGSASN